MTCTPAPEDLRHALALLSTPALIRLITEIDDNGPIPPRRLSTTLCDLPSHHLRRAADQARTLGLVHAGPGGGLALAAPGVALADLYDATARWARQHAYPARLCGFTRRVQHTFRLLSQPTADTTSPGPRAAVPLLSSRAAADLTGPRGLLLQWLSANPQVLHPEAEAAA
ncbi:regulator [Streptomyces sp. NPDC004111]|uniref:regulator n=1 Tax=Streptomyces sp. NPDC004111 TaxID=3364690 RepID=UPI00369B6FD2